MALTIPISTSCARNKRTTRLKSIQNHMLLFEAKQPHLVALQHTHTLNDNGRSFHGGKKKKRKQRRQMTQKTVQIMTYFVWRGAICKADVERILCNTKIAVAERERERESLI